MLQQTALRYAHRGWAVLPLHTIVNGKCSCQNNCDSPGKHPRIKQGLLNATTDINQITQWWHKWPQANIGIRTGSVSGIVVIDIDPRHDGDNSLSKLEHTYRQLPDTLEAGTGSGGRHVYFRHPGGYIPNGAGIFGDGIDIRGDGGYVVAPPSIHISGRKYSWDIGTEQYDLAPMPDWLIQLLQAQTNRVPEKVEGSIPEGRRHDTLLSFAGSMRRRGMRPESIYAALEIENQRCHPPISNHEIKNIAYSMDKYTPQNPTHRKGGKDTKPKGGLPPSCLPDQLLKP